MVWKCWGCDFNIPADFCNTDASLRFGLGFNGGDGFGLATRDKTHKYLQPVRVGKRLEHLGYFFNFFFFAYFRHISKNFTSSRIYPRMHGILKLKKLVFKEQYWMKFSINFKSESTPFHLRLPWWMTLKKEKIVTKKFYRITCKFSRDLHYVSAATICFKCFDPWNISFIRFLFSIWSWRQDTIFMKFLSL